MKKTIQRKYARLIARTGANIQKGQPVRLYINVDRYEFASILVDECYKAGASRVDIDWMSQPIQKLNIRHRTLKSLSHVQKWEEERMKLMAEELPCRIIILSDDPDGLKGVNQEKMQKDPTTTARVLFHLGEKTHEASVLTRNGELALILGAGAGRGARGDLSVGRDEPLEELHILVIDIFDVVLREVADFTTGVHLLESHDRYSFLSG